MAMEEIKPITQYGMKTTVDIEWSTTNWAEKQDYKSQKKHIEQAKKIFAGIYKDVVVDYDYPKVTWFMEDNNE